MASADRYDAKYDKGGNEEVGFFDSEEQQQQQEYGQHEFEEDYDVEDDEDEINSSRLIHPRDIEQYPQYHHHSSEEGAADVNTNEEENSDDSEVGLDGDVDSLKEKHRTEWQSLQNQEMNSLAEFEEIERGIICNMQQEEVPASDDSLHPLHALAAVGNDTSERAYMEDEVIVVKNNINNAHCGFIETEEEEQEDAVVLETTTSHLHHQHQRRRSNLFDESQVYITCPREK